MQGLAIFLFVLGALFIYCGWKTGSRQNKELYTALVALSKLKKDVAQLERDYLALAEKVDRSHMWQAEVAEVKEELDSLRQALDRHLSDLTPDAQAAADEQVQTPAPAAESLFQEEAALVGESNVYSLEWFRGQGPSQSEAVKVASAEGISEKYHKVIALAQSGMSVSQVAEELNISQDAVTMVLRTYRIGGRR